MDTGSAEQSGFREALVKLFLILVGIVVAVVGAQYFLDSEPAVESCAAEPLPDCASIERTGSHVTVANSCAFDITVQWEFLAGSNQIHDLEPGQNKRVSSYPVKVDSISCCPEYNRCW
jgi:hypothetical protein